MSTTISNRYIVDLPEWRALSNSFLNTNSSPFTVAGAVMAPDMRGRNYANPNVVFNWSGVASCYNFKLDSWNYVISLGMGGTTGQGATAVFCPKFSPSGLIAAGATDRSFTIDAATPLLSTGVAINWMAQRGDGLGHIVRIIDNGVGGTGKTEERRVISNTSGTTPIVYLDKAMSFVPVTGSTFEFLSGSVLFLNTGIGSTANIFRRYDLLTNTITSLNTTGTFIATIPNTYNQLVATDEQYVPYDRNPGEGYIVGTSTYDTSGDFSKNCLLATAVPAANQLTGQATDGDAAVLADQFRNYQIRIVEDLTNPTAVGQRRRITTHTAGPSPVYTLASNWTVNPSATCKFVIENNTNNIIGFFQGATLTYNYSISGNTWDTTTWASRAVALSTGGITWHAFGVSPTTSSSNDLRSSNIISFRGGTAFYDVLDISGAATGTWTSGLGITFNGNSASGALVANNDSNYFAYNPHTQEGKYMYFALGSSSNYGAVQRMYARFDSASGIVSWIAGPKVAQGSNSLATSSCWAHCCVFQDGNTKVAFYNTPRFMSPSEYMQLMLTF